MWSVWVNSVNVRDLTQVTNALGVYRFGLNDIPKSMKSID